MNLRVYLDVKQYGARFRLKKLLGRRPRPGFSVALITHNRPAFLKEAIRSVLTSTTGPFELLIWDNGSDADTRDVIAR